MNFLSKLLRSCIQKRWISFGLLTFITIQAFWLLGCEQNHNEEIYDASKIFGDPIKDPLESNFSKEASDEENSTSLQANISTGLEGKEESNVTGRLVMNKKPFAGETNQSSTSANTSSLPPLESNGVYKPIAFRDLSSFNYEVNWEEDGKDFNYPAYASRVPETIRSLSQVKVALEGFMIPTIVDENNEVKEFLLLPDQMSCCFGQTPEANGWVVVSANKGVEVMMDRIIRVTGRMVVEERWDEEFFVGLYHLSCDDITGPAL